MADATFFLPKEMNHIEREHFYNCLVRKLAHGQCILETLQVPGDSTLCVMYSCMCFSKAPTSMHQTHWEEESKVDQDVDSRSRSMSGSGA